MPNVFPSSRAIVCLLLTFLPFFAISQTDTVPPHLVCKNFQEANIGYQCQLMFNQNDLLESATDNITPAAQLEFGLRLRCTGSGFPENQKQVSLGGNDLYNYSPIEVWARDLAGNTSVCESTILLVDNFSNCDPAIFAWASFAGNSAGIPNVLINITATSCSEESVKILEATTAQNGSLLAGGGIPTGYHAIVSATKNTNPLNGITIHDLFLISQHILGITPLTNPFQLIAADADQDGQITKNDMLTLRRLMNGTISQLPNGRSWRFVPSDFVFDPLHPFVFPETISVVGGASYFGFTGVKIGDVDFSANPAL